MKLNINIFKGKRKPEGYVEKYLRPQKPEGCERKAVYISRENHEAVRRIIGMLGSRKTTISGYIDRILAEHLGLPPKSVYVTYHPVSDWGWNGRNF